MLKQLFTLSALFLFGQKMVQAQTLYMPRNIKAAFEKGTRSIDGKPGPNYWQNKGVYDIQLTAYPDQRKMEGTETIQYDNNSPDSLKGIVLRFVNNIHKPTAARDGAVSEDFLTSGLVVKSIMINGQPYKINNDAFTTVYNLKLKAALLPKSKNTIDIVWKYPLSKLSGREGMLDSTTTYAAYSYPRISVYDDYNGWDRIEHSDRAEFYNDFNDYKVSVKAPKNYVVWGTGDLLNPDEVLQPEISEKLKKSYKADSTIHIATLGELQAGKVTQQKDWNEWKFAATHITDVCFAIGDHYVWDGASVVVDPQSNKRVSMQAAYNDTTIDFPHAVQWGAYALKSFSTKWPGVAYPYPKMTAVQGQADMEYPMMVNDGTVGKNFRFAQMLQDHEMAHTYFPFYMGINETRYAYMDEGWATTFEYLIGIDEYGKEDADKVYKGFRVNRYIHDPSTEEDQPIISMSTQVSGAGYGNNSYGKASLSYLALKDMLGDDLFKKALHNYMNNWNGKHPIPWDYFNSMNAGSGQDLNWFFQNWVFTNNYIDLKINEVKTTKSGATISIQNVGGFAIPFDIVVKYADGSDEKFHKTPIVWKADQTTTNITISTKKKISSISLDGDLFMDATPADNTKIL
ncbi:MAG: aminopeptidase [Pseudopedobacter saltans]|uniref:Aminopeptidase n=1 Tax=Pseudopedobacter saltans TaxID=151895 RepID=A0A2W5HE62_9SPHI|nr:MAG: aminopeptidase [Pseudopedobacter saltans]